MSVSSAKRRALAPVLIIMLGVLGLWLGWLSQFWVGLIVFIVAFAGLAVMSQLDLYPTEEERRSGWRHIMAKGKLKYVSRQVLRSWPFMVFLLVIDLSNSYQSGRTWNPLWFATFFALMVGSSVLVSLGWWYWQQKKYGNAP